MRNSICLLMVFMAFGLIGCKDEPVPKPRAMLRLEYPEQNYRWNPIALLFLTTIF